MVDFGDEFHFDRLKWVGFGDNDVLLFSFDVEWRRRGGIITRG